MGTDYCGFCVFYSQVREGSFQAILGKFLCLKQIEISILIWENCMILKKMHEKINCKQLPLFGRKTQGTLSLNFNIF